MKTQLVKTTTTKCNNKKGTYQLNFNCNEHFKLNFKKFFKLSYS